MSASAPSALITDQGRNIMLRLGGRLFTVTQPALRRLLGLPDGPAGLGITVDRDRLHFEFPGDGRSVTVTAAQLRRRLAEQAASGLEIS